jgi:glycosyltransferase involved in cell wall biosynthesis
MNKPLNIVFLSHTFLGGSFVVGSHHLARNLARLGHSVAHISTPITPFHLFRRSNNKESLARFELWQRHGQHESPSLFEYVPMSLIPWTFARWALTSKQNPYLLTGPTIRSVLQRQGFDSIDILLVDQPKFAGIRHLLNPRRLVYRATDLYASLTGDAIVNRAEKILSNQEADLLIGTSWPVLNHLEQLAPGKPSLLLENGVDLEHFSEPRSQPAEYVDRRRPRILYVGAIDDRFDTKAIAILANERPDWDIFLVGPISRDLSEILDISNVSVLGSRPYRDLPAFMQHADIGLLPLNNHPANAGRSPMKLYEYAAAGLPVVAKRTPELSRRSDNFVVPYDESNKIAQALDQAVHLERKQIVMDAQHHGWTHKAQVLLDFVTRDEETQK